MKIKLLLLLSIFILATSFKRKTNPAASPLAMQNLNISFLLDLSDRIDPKKNPGIYQRDVQHIKSVEAAFIAHVQKKKILLLKDQIQVYFEPIPSNKEIDQLGQQLKVSFGRSTGKQDITKTDKIFAEIPAKIYQSAIKDGNYIGSDIWRFFNSKVKKYCIKDNQRNILVILTDGYMYHKRSLFMDGNKSSYLTPDLIKSRRLSSFNFKDVIKKNNLGFIPATSGLQGLEVLVLGINPSKTNPFEEDVINQYWSDWLRAMNVKRFSINSTDLPSFLDPVIRDFIK